jgi:ankyrin repeat protein
MFAMAKNMHLRATIYFFASLFFISAFPSSALSKNSPEQPSELIRALRNGESNEAEKLIRKGQDINSQDEYGWSPLMYAVLNKDCRKFDQLLSLGANPNLQDLDGITPLIAAIIQLPLPFMKMYSPEMDTRMEYIALNLISKGADPNLADNDGNTPLLYATLGGQDQIVKALIKKGADPNRADSRGCTPLYLALHPDEALGWAPATGALRRNLQLRRIRYGVDGTSADVQVEVVKARKEAATLIEQTRSRIAAMLKSAGAVEPNAKIQALEQNLIDSLPKKLGSPEEQMNWLHNILRNSNNFPAGTGHYILLAKVTPDGTVKNVLVISGMSKHVSEQLQAAAYKLRYQPALKQGRPVEAWDVLEGYSGLKITTPNLAGSGSPVINTSSNAQKNNKIAEVDSCSKEDGLTPLMCAARDNEAGQFKKALRKTADINARDIYGWTALTYSAAQGNDEMAQELLSKNADPNILDADGRSILMHAVDGNNNKIVALLLKNKADASAHDKKGATALGLAWAKANDTVVALLEKAGVPPLKPEEKRSEIYSEPLPTNGQLPTLPMMRPFSQARPDRFMLEMEPGTYRMKIRVLVGVDGKVRKVRVLTGLPRGFTAEKMKELYALQYKPAMKDGQPVEAWANGDFSFTKFVPTGTIIPR